MPSMVCRVILFVVLVILTATSADAERKRRKPSDKARIVLTSQESGRKDEQKFSCQKPIHAYVDLPEKFAGKHLIEGSWYRPDRTVQEKTKFEVQFSTGGPKTTYLWLKMAENEKNVLDEFSLGGDYGAEEHEFTGDWTLEIRVDGEVVTQKTFKVVCN